MSIFWSGFITATAIWLAYLIALIIYRLYFHPLAKFPGPKYAAVSKWHEYYYDVHLQGKFIFYIEGLHKTYGTWNIYLVDAVDDFPPKPFSSTL
jgi:hypothetical protein